MAESIKKNMLTRAGLERYEKELEELVSVKRKEVAEKIKIARELGDLSENAEYDAAKEEQGHNEKERIRNLILYEPNGVEVFNSIVPEYLGGLIYGGVCESVASELAARSNAMEKATGNAQDMIDELNLYYNRERQAGITQEITEIVGGAECL